MAPVAMLQSTPRQLATKRAVAAAHTFDNKHST
jgi:hypothetical protein